MTNCHSLYSQNTTISRKYVDFWLKIVLSRYQTVCYTKSKYLLLKVYRRTKFSLFCRAQVRRNNWMKPNGLDFSFLGQLTSICLLLRCPLEWILRFDHPITSIGLALNASSGKNLILKLNSAGFKMKFLMNSTRILLEFW